MWRDSCLNWGHGAAFLPHSLWCAGLFCPTESTRKSLDKISVVVLWVGQPGFMYQLSIELVANCPAYPGHIWDAPWPGAPRLSVLDNLDPSQLGSKASHLCVLVSPRQPGSYLPVAVIVGDFLPNQHCFAVVPVVSGLPMKARAAGCGPCTAHQQPGGVEQASGEKSWFANQQSQTWFPWVSAWEVGFYRALLSCARLPWPHCRWQWDDAELDVFFLFCFVFFFSLMLIKT